MEITAKVHVPTTQYGYIEKEYSFIEGKEEDFDKTLVEGFKRLHTLWNSPEGTKAVPSFLGQTVIENGHIYKAVQNEGSDKLYWMIDKI